ncbi:MAG: hypothetical protein N4J56_002362 [Chroococcidiopsis sp. SAG 2025]|uniref:DUF1830 domain-containing protein n=1 Tax=Chroococcidiopsis sp. SAG 2025 TaxID=171389 RepID=UPI0029372FE4|nr:DUF1830 domain-containing protein [Chroococcidiopsis sp. SAG 2025]MDV2992708.1 hypothetical protein [Chroococcidiopsis sp. SAG 2025]
MIQALDRVLPIQSSVLCCYANTTNSLQVVRITNIPHWWFERVVFPGQRLLFEAVPDARLEIHTGAATGSILSDKISCDRLRVGESSVHSEDDEFRSRNY